MASWFFTYPIDILKTKIQVDYNTNLLKEFNSFKTYRCMFKGVIPCCLRAFPVNSV